MKKVSLKTGVLLLVVIMLISLMACSNNNNSTNSGSVTNSPENNKTEENATNTETPAEEVTLKMYVHYTSEDEKAQLDYAMAEMKKIMPNVTLDIDVMPQDSGAKLKTYFATGNLPDIFEVAPSDIAIGVNSKSMVPLDDYINKFNLTDELTPAALSQLEQQDGHTWAMPASNSNFALIYVNKTLFEQAGAKIPENFQELIEAGKLLKKQDVVPLGIWLKETWPVLQLFDMAAIPGNPKGITALDMSGEGTAADPEFQNAAAKILELAKEGLISKDAFTMDYNSAVAQFESGKSAMLMVGNWMTQPLGEKLGEGNVTVLLPHVFADAEDVEAVKVAGGISGGGFVGGYAVAANSKHKEIAAEYAVQLALKNAEGRIVKTGEFNTLLKKQVTSEKPENALQKEVSTLLTSVQSTTTMGWAFENSKIQTDLGNEVQKLYTGDYSIESFTKNVDTMLEKYRNE